MKKLIIPITLLLVGLLTACSGASNSATVPIEATIQQPSFNNIFAENKQLFEQLQANIPFEVSPPNATAKTIKLIIPTIF